MLLKNEFFILLIMSTSTTFTYSFNAVDAKINNPALNDILASKTTTNSINTTTNAISDLKQGINLNDKLLFIKDLFNGFNLAYAEAIELANKLPNFGAADAFFQKNYAVKNNWAEKQQTVDKFYEILNRRFNHQG